MRSEPNVIADKYRTSHPMMPDTEFGDSFGYFEFQVESSGETMRIISSGIQPRGGWEHVSVSLWNRCPTWEEMSLVKSLFWDDGETVIQFHPPKSKHINFHQFCLHLWSMTGHAFELPPSNLIA